MADSSRTDSSSQNKASGAAGIAVGLATIGAFFAFFIFGFMDNVKGPALPGMLRDLGLSYGQGGTVLLGGYLGFLVATLLTGVLSDVAGRKAVILVAGFCLVLGIGALTGLKSVAGFALGIAAIGAGLGCIEVGGNAMVADLHTKRPGLYLNLLAFFHSLGAMVAPAYAGILLSRAFGWRTVYLLVLIPVGALPLFFLFVRYPRPRADHREGFSLAHLGRRAFSGDMLLAYALLIVYVAAELGMGAWLVTYLQDHRGLPNIRGALYLSLFFAMLTLGRLIGSFVVDRWGYMRTVLTASALSVVCIGLGAFGPDRLIFMLPLTGLFFSVVFPNVTAVVSVRNRENRGAVLGLLFMFAGMGGMLGPWAIGVVSDLFGIRWALSVVLLCCVGMVGFSAPLAIRWRRVGV